jgi:hypothetical protein
MKIMLSEKEVALVYETLLSSPGMNDVVKLDLRVPRKQVLLLAKIMEKGLQVKENEALDGLLRAAGDGTKESLEQIGAELLAKAGLSEMSNKLQTLQPGAK